MNQNQRLAQVEAARKRWLDACNSGQEHGVCLRFWESYVALARLAKVQP